MLNKYILNVIFVIAVFWKPLLVTFCTVVDKNIYYRRSQCKGKKENKNKDYYYSTSNI